MRLRGTASARATGLALAALVVPFAGCSGVGLGIGGDDVDVQGDWVFVSGSTPAGDLAPPARELPTMVFDAGSGGGHTGCNAYGGPVDHDGADLRFDYIEQTFMGCSGSVGAFESAYLAALDRVDHVARDGNVLTLTGDDVVLEFAVMPDWPEQAVVGRTWRLDYVTSDADPSARTPAGDRDGGPADPATLYLSDEEVIGSNGCHRFTGTWALHNGVITLTSYEGGQECPPELLDQAMWVTHVLGRFTAEVRLRSGSRELVLTAAVADPDGARRQLVYRS